MDEAIESIGPMSDDQVFDYTQLLRRKFVDTVTENGVKVPTDPKEAKVFLSALADMDKIAIGKKRLRSEEEMNKHSAQAIADLAAAVKQSMQSNEHDAIDTDRQPPPLNETGMPPLELVEGETHVGSDAIDYSAFEKRIKC